MMKQDMSSAVLIMVAATVVGLIWSSVTGGFLHWIPILIGIAVGAACMKAENKPKGKR